MFLKINMIEPVSASVCLYLISKSNKKILTRTLKRPSYLQKKISKFVKKNEDLLIDLTKDEIIDMLFDLKVMMIYNPSILLIIYVILLIVTIFI